jgi:hypothetical protein
MTPSNVKRDQTKGERILFALSLVVLGGILGGLVLMRPGVLLVIAVAAGASWIVSMLWNKEEPRKTQLLGLASPLVFGTAYATMRWGAAEIVVASLFWIAAAAAATGVIANRGFSRRLYDGWLLAFLPFSWTISQFLLAIIYYLVVTPIALLMRVAGRDPLCRRFDPTAETYWIRRKQPSDPKRYFKQF